MELKDRYKKLKIQKSKPPRGIWIFSFYDEMKKWISWFCLAFLVLLVVYYFYPEQKLPDVTIDKIVVLKSERKLQAYSNGKLVKSYSVSLGRNPAGDKEYEGDDRTPEGNYIINSKNPGSKYHKNLGISYSNEEDIAQAKKIGKPAGGEIKIHGMKDAYSFIGKFQRWIDWTAGCIALTNDEIDELYAHVPLGTKIEIRK